MLLQKGADVESQDYGGLTPLSWAEWLEQKETVNLLRKAKTEQEAPGRREQVAYPFPRRVGYARLKLTRSKIH